MSEIGIKRCPNCKDFMKFHMTPYGTYYVCSQCGFDTRDIQYTYDNKTTQKSYAQTYYEQNYNFEVGM